MDGDTPAGYTVEKLDKNDRKLGELEHDIVRDGLESILKRYVDEQFLSTTSIEVCKETGISVPWSSNYRRPDVRVDFNDADAISDHAWYSDLNGCTFEVKTRRDIEKAAQQLHRDIEAGYQTVIVTPGWLLVDDRGYKPSYEWFVELYRNASAIEIVSAHPLRFTKSAVGQHLALPNLREFLLQTQCLHPTE